MAAPLRLEIPKADAALFQLQLKKLTKVDQGRVVRYSLRKALQVQQKEGKKTIRQYVGKVTGNLLRSFKIKIKSSSAYGKVGSSKKGYTLHWIDGHQLQPRYTKKGVYKGIMFKGKPTTKWGGKPYKPHGKPHAWTAAFNANRQKMVNIIVKGFRDALNSITQTKTY